MPIEIRNGLTFYRLESETLAELVDIATEIPNQPPEDMTTTLMCIPSITMSWKVNKFLDATCKQSNIEPTHENVVRAALYHCMEFAVDTRGNFYIID